MRSDRRELPLRIVVDHPLPGVAIALQSGASGKESLVAPVHASSESLVFDFSVTLDGSTAAGGPRLLGPFVYGPPVARFVYLNAGAAAGQFGSVWRRRAKVPLDGIDWRMVEELKAGARLTVHIQGTGRDGGPACASVPILSPGWRTD